MLSTHLLRAATEKVAKAFQHPKKLQEAIDDRRAAMQAASASRDIPEFIGQVASPGGRYLMKRDSLVAKVPGTWIQHRKLTPEELEARAKTTKNGYELRAIHDELRSQGHPGIAHMVPKGFRGHLTSTSSLIVPSLMALGLGIAGEGALYFTGRSRKGPLTGMEPILDKLKQTGVEVFSEHGAADHFSPSNNHIWVNSLSHPAVLAHEAGHALGHHGGRLRRGIGKVDDYSRVFAPAVSTALMAAAPFAMDTSLEEDPEKRKKRLGRYRDALIAASASHLPTLLEEGLASAHGAKLIADTQGVGSGIGAAARLLPAFATYGASAAIPGLAAYYVHQKMHPEKYKGRRWLFFKGKPPEENSKVQEKTKVAAMSDVERKKSRQDYYMQHRGAILAASAAYRSRNAGKIRKKAKKYRREVASGIRKQRERYSSGNSYVFGGFR